jgi:predicted glycosyl hydrolase (DUF1957 family)
MKNIEFKLLQLKDKLESTAFLVSKTGSEKQVHSEIVQSLVILSEVLQLLEIVNPMKKNDKKSLADSTNTGEINKVADRLRLWAKRQNNINARILNAFLELERSGVSVITEDALKSKLPELNTFKSNFDQMKTIAPKNHGKVFEQYGEEITLWEPIALYVREYERVTRKVY